MQVVIDEILTHYEAIGDNKQTLLILHGWKRSLTEWLPVAKQLSTQYKVILLDLPGFGQTPMPNKTFSIYDYATFVDHFLGKLEISHVTLLGHSFGGRIGIILSAKTKKITQLILVDAAGVEKRTLFAKINISSFKLAKLFFPEKVIEKLRKKLGSRDYRTAGPMRDIFVKVVNEDLTKLLSKIFISTLIIWGNNDSEVAEWKTKLMKKLISNSRLRVVWGSDHSPHLEKPKEFMEILNDFLIQTYG